MNNDAAARDLWAGLQPPLSNASASSARAMPRPWTLRQDRQPRHTTTGMGSGMLRLKRQG